MRAVIQIIGTCFFFLILLTSCAYNPFSADNHLTGTVEGTAVGAAVGAGGIALLGGTKPLIALGGIGGGAIGYYFSTLRYDASGVIASGGEVFQIGDYVGIYLPTDKIFEPNTANFIPHARFLLSSTASVLERFPNQNILISGNTSGFYLSAWEQKLSEERAQKVAAYLWNAGINHFQGGSINTRKLNYVGYGDFMPISNQITNDGLRENSRIQITVYPTDRDLGIDKRHLAMNNVGAVDN